MYICGSKHHNDNTAASTRHTLLSDLMKNFLAGPVDEDQGQNFAIRLKIRCEVGLPGAGSWMIPASGIFFLVIISILLINNIAVAQPPPGVGPGLSVTKTNDLQFGTVIAGAPYTILPSDASAAGFQIRWPGPAGREVDVSFSLPSQLFGAGSILPITFGPGSLEWDINQNGNNRRQANPAFPLRLPTGGGGRAYLWLGGTVDVDPGARNGVYGNVIVVTVSEVYN
jgi:hypothetical protein